MNDVNETDQFIGGISGVITFIAAWIYCMAKYGFLFGFGLGWLPAAILGAIVGLVMVFLWKFVAFSICAGILYLSYR